MSYSNITSHYLGKNHKDIYIGIFLKLLACHLFENQIVNVI